MTRWNKTWTACRVYVAVWARGHLRGYERRLNRHPRTPSVHPAHPDQRHADTPWHTQQHTSTPSVLRHVHREWALLSFHSVCLSGCLSVIPRPTAYHDWSITTKSGRQVHTFPRTRVSLFGSPISHTFGARGKNMQNFAYCVFLPLRTWCIVPYDLLPLAAASCRRQRHIFFPDNLGKPTTEKQNHSGF